MSDDDSLGSAGDDDVQVAAQISSMLKRRATSRSPSATAPRATHENSSRADAA